MKGYTIVVGILLVFVFTLCGIVYAQGASKEEAGQDAGTQTTGADQATGECVEGQATGTGQATGQAATEAEAVNQGLESGAIGGRPAGVSGLGERMNDSGTGIQNEQQERSYGEGKVNINTATSQELVMVPGIDRSMADNIVSFRDSNGPFCTLDDLTKVQGMDKEKLDSMRFYLKVEGPTDLQPDLLTPPEQGRGPFMEYGEPK